MNKQTKNKCGKDISFFGAIFTFRQLLFWSQQPLIGFKDTKNNQKLLKLHLKSYQKTQDFSLSFTMSWMFNDNRVITINTVFWNSWKVIVCDVPVLQPLAITAKFESNIRSYSMGWAMKKTNIFSRYDYFFLFSIRRQ